jgi:AcrR family transcriptional regulator
MADHAERRRLIVDVAVRLLKKLGPESVTIRRVADCLSVGAMTLYTYVDGQAGLRLAMTQYGFDLLSDGCRAHSTLDTPQGWRGSAKHYIQFAIENPHLYKLMFATEVDSNEAEAQILHRGFEGLIDRVRQQMEVKGMTQAQIDAKALITAGRYWIALHGLASLAIAGRLGVLKADMDTLLDSLLERVAPT